MKTNNVLIFFLGIIVIPLLIGLFIFEQIFGLIILFISMIVQVIIPPIPAELIVISAGKLYGVFLTTLIAGTGLYVGSILVYFLGKYIHKTFESFFNKEKVKIITDKIKQYESAILWLRILPYNPSDIISYAAGIIHVEKKKFFIISFFTSYIRCLVLASLGVYITGIQTLFVVIIVLFASAILAHSIVVKYKK